MKRLLALEGVKMPNNCHDCDALGINDVVGFNCPCHDDLDIYDYEKRPEQCPLRELLIPPVIDLKLELNSSDIWTDYNGNEMK